MQAGDRVDKYILERKLGEGGMAQVWVARHVDLGKHVAIKCLSTRLTTNPEFEQRFLSEGRRQAGLRHPNIVEVVDFLVKGDDRFLVMDYIEGETITVRQKRSPGPLPLPLAESVGQDIALALDYAHKKGLVHRDVKPSNILLDEADKAFLTDFGIALAVGEDRLTRTGVAVGTVHYMSPEQIARPREIDHRTDIYSFGCVLYDMLTGRPPFVSPEGDTDFTVMNGHLTQPPPSIRSLNPETPEAVEQVVLKCLAKDPKDRYQTGEELARALRRAFHPDATTRELAAMSPSEQPTATQQFAPPAPTGMRGGLWVILAVFGLLVLGGGAAALYWNSREKAEPVTQKEPAPIEPQTPSTPAVPPPEPPVQANVQPAGTPATPPPAAPKPVISKPIAPKSVTKEPTPAQLRLRACMALGLSEAQCVERLKKSQ